MRKLFVLTLFVILFAMMISPGYARNTGFECEDVDGESMDTIFKRFELEVIDEPIVTYGFSYFDVNEMGHYALGFNNVDKDMILVYDSDCTFLYGLSFIDNGAFGFEFDGSNIILYSVRSDLAVSVDKNGNCLDMKKVQSTPQNSDYWYEEVFANIRNINGATFTAEHWLFNHELLHWGRYPRLVKTMPDGERVVLFDTTENTFAAIRFIIIFAGVLLLLTVVILVIRRAKYHPQTKNV